MFFAIQIILQWVSQRYFDIPSEKIITKTERIKSKYYYIIYVIHRGRYNILGRCHIRADKILR